MKTEEERINREFAEWVEAKGSPPLMTALQEQIGGKHYKSMKIQPVEFCMANRFNFCQSSAIKYICRYKVKNGEQDIDKAIHFLELLKQLEYPKEPGEFEPKVGDMVIAWGDYRVDAIIGTYSGYDKDQSKHTVSETCKLHKNVVKWNGTLEHLEKVRKGEV